ncbi:MAG: GerMN domain-containing protein, partial [Rhodoluna sp.]
MRKFFGSLALMATLSALLTGCVQLPRDGQIELGPNLQNELTTDYLYYSPSGPVEGDSPEQIINGFLNAGTGPQNDYAVAREFLTTSFRNKWNPNERVLIQDGKPQVTLTIDDSASVTVTESAQVDDQGKYESLNSGTRETFSYVFKKESGEWRIAEAPNVTMIIRPVFDAVFREYSIYFFDNQQKYLIPDVRWFPARASTSTRLVTAMLKGPSDWLVGAVRSPIPEGTKLSLSTVSVSDGVAYVDFSAKALNASRLGLQLTTVQLKETLMQLDGVFSVRVSIERTPIEVVPIASGLVTPLTFSPVALSEGSLSHVDISNSTTVTSATDLIGKYEASDFALSADEKRIVMLTPTGVYSANLNSIDQKVSLLTVAQGWLSPVIDRQGFIWLVPKSGKRSIEVFDSNGNIIDFNTGWLTKQNRIG